MHSYTSIQTHIYIYIYIYSLMTIAWCCIRTKYPVCRSLYYWSVYLFFCVFVFPSDIIFFILAAFFSSSIWSLPFHFLFCLFLFILSFTICFLPPPRPHFLLLLLQLLSKFSRPFCYWFLSRQLEIFRIQWWCFFLSLNICIFFLFICTQYYNKGNVREKKHF